MLALILKPSISLIKWAVYAVNQLVSNCYYLTVQQLAVGATRLFLVCRDGIPTRWNDRPCSAAHPLILQQLFKRIQGFLRETRYRIIIANNLTSLFVSCDVEMT